MEPSHEFMRPLLADDAWLRRLVRRLIRDEDQVDDVIQDTWLAAVEDAVPGAGPRPPGWFRKVAWNFALRRKRAASRRRTHESVAGVPDEAPSSFRILEREDARHAVAEAVRSLEEPYRSTILLRYFENLPPRIIAQRTNVPVSAVKTRLTRGLHQLRVRLDSRFGGDRRAWSVVLAPLAAGTVPASSAGISTLLGAVVMSTKAKVVSAVAAMVVLGTVVGFVLTRSSSVSSPAPGAPHRQAPPALLEGATSTRPQPALDEEVSPGPTTRGAAPAAPGRILTGCLHGSIQFDDDPPTPCADAEVFVLQEKSGLWKRETTAPSGAYRIPDLKPGTWKILVRLVDYPDISGTMVEVDAGEEVVQDFVVKRGITVSGRVVDSVSREGIVRASVTFQGRRAHAVTTGKGGAYVARGLDRDMLLGRVHVTADRYNPSWECFEVDDGNLEAIEIDIELRALAQVMGTVVDTTGVPVSGARVAATFTDLFRQDRPGTATDASGRFSLLVSGSWSANREMPVALFAYHPGYAYGRTEPTYHADGEVVRGVTLRLRRAGSIVGSVEGGIAPGGAEVVLWPADASRRVRAFHGFALRFEGQYRITASADGQYRFDDLVPGRYCCRAVQGRFVSPRLTVEVIPDRTIRDVQLRLALPDGTITGRVVDGQEQPIAGARVSVRLALWRPGEPPIVWRHLQSDSDGNFQADVLSDGEYFVGAHKHGFSGETQTKVRPSQGTLVIRLRRHSAVRGVVLRPDGAPAVRFKLVVDKVGGDGPGWPVRRRKRNAIGGVFRVTLPHGERTERYRIHARTDEGLLSQWIPVEVVPGQDPAPIRLQLSAGAVLRGIVKGRSGRPVVSASVQVRGRTSGTRRQTKTSLSGRFNFPGLRTDTYDVRAVHHERGSAVRTLHIGSTAEHFLSLILDDTGGTLRLVVQTADGRPVSGARVYRCEPVKQRHQAEFERRRRAEPGLTWDGYRRRLVHTDADGQWEGRFLPPRTYPLLIRAEGYRDAKIEVDLGPQEEHRRTVVLERGSRDKK